MIYVAVAGDGHRPSIKRWLDGGRWFCIIGDMTPEFAAACGEFLQHYGRDLSVRWSADDLAAQQAFAQRHLPSSDWLDWTGEAAAMQLLQANMLGVALGEDREARTIMLAGPVVELLEPTVLFQFAARQLKPGGSLIGIVPCLRDNSPESRVFAELAAATCWPYATAEELTEALGEAGLAVQDEVTGFVAIPRFTEAVLKDQLGFKGFRRIFDQLAAQGYDPLAVGWGELRFMARVIA